MSSELLSPRLVGYDGAPEAAVVHVDFVARKRQEVALAAFHTRIFSGAAKLPIPDEISWEQEAA